MSMMALKMTVFLLMATAGIQIVEISGIVPDTSGNYPTAEEMPGGKTVYGTLVSAMASMFGDQHAEQLTYLSLSLATFGLLVFTLPVIIGILVYGFVIGTWFITKLDLPTEWTVAFTTMIALIYVLGYIQYKANTSLREPL